ncbi:TBC1 domain family member 15-like isoform X3 [Argiope bruennichi]|uniref:TBC1 domain family member 15-like isoform X3 n=1 Tax=Argiope bruennichi TaxID=94029 RepID=UPI0024947656|nr:TBC1 domain family member 15-like isoform X3 [Argiope bruennichi]
MEGRKRSVAFELGNVIVTLVGPMKDEASFVGKLMIVEENHGPDIEWHPLRLKADESQTNSPELETLDWEDVSSSVGYKANHDESIDAVEIKSIKMPNVIKFDIADLKSYKRTDLSEEHKTIITFLLKDGTNIPSFQFDVCDFGKFCAALDNYVNFKRSKKESNLYLTIDPKVEALEKSFSELDLFTDSKSHIITLNIDHQEEPGYELITCIELPPRPAVNREEPVTLEEWNSHLDAEGRIKEFESLKARIFKGGLANNIRKEAWKYLLNVFRPDVTNKEKAVIQNKNSESYFQMKLQWKSFTPDQESRFSALRDRKSLIEKDVSRTDRTHPFFEGENNANIQMLQEILMTYCMYNFDLGYVQGMSDLLSPILVVMQDEVDAFWCFAGWLKLIGSNFELEQQGMKNQLQDLHRLLHFVDSQLCSYLEKHDSGNMYFAFRWLLILFKRDFKFMEIMRLWEVLWTGLPCKNFHLLICIAILDSEKLTIMENGYGLTEILKHVNEMSYKINLEETLCKAEAIYLQIKNSKYRSDVVEAILGLDPLPVEEKPVIKSKDSPSSCKNGAAVFASKKNSEVNESTDTIDEYVDLDQNYPTLFDLPY